MTKIIMLLQLAEKCGFSPSYWTSANCEEIALILMLSTGM